jgi:hypothetical protein
VPTAKPILYQTKVYVSALVACTFTNSTSLVIIQFVLYGRNLRTCDSDAKVDLYVKSRKYSAIPSVMLIMLDSDKPYKLRM